MNVLFSLSIASPISERALLFLKGHRGSPACPSGKTSIEMSVEYSCSVTVRGKPKYWEENLS